MTVMAALDAWAPCLVRWVSTNKSLRNCCRRRVASSPPIPNTEYKPLNSWDPSTADTILQGTYHIRKDCVHVDGRREVQHAVLARWGSDFSLSRSSFADGHLYPLTTRVIEERHIKGPALTALSCFSLSLYIRSNVETIV